MDVRFLNFAIILVISLTGLFFVRSMRENAVGVPLSPDLTEARTPSSDSIFPKAATISLFPEAQKSIGKREPNRLETEVNDDKILSGEFDSSETPTAPGDTSQ